MSWGTTDIDFGRTARQAADALLTAPRLAFHAVSHGLLPMPVSTAMVAIGEGLSELHWKVVGDALVRFARRSGPLVTKLGQILATRTDLLPEALCRRLETLYSGQPAMSPAELGAILAQAFPDGTPFVALDPRPLGVGSIGQVHRASLPSGAQVIVKLLRPGIERQIERDLNALELALAVAVRIPGLVQPLVRDALTRGLADLAAALRTEVDLRREAMALEDFGRRLRTNPQVCVPRIYREWCSAEALVMEELSGEPVSRFRQRVANEPLAARRVADLALREILTQVFEHGHFHADPHAGNLLVLPDGRLGIIDLGLTGETKPEDRQRIARAVRAFMSGDAEALTRALLDFGVPPPTFQYEEFRDAIARVVRQNEASVMAQLTGKASRDEARGLETLVGQLFRVAAQHGLYVPPATTLLVKTIVTIEGVARSLHPEVNVLSTALPIVLRSMRPSWMRWDFWRDVATDLAGLLDPLRPSAGPRT